MTSKQSTAEIRRVAHLDGLRGVAVLLVVSHHYVHMPFHPAAHPNNWFLPFHHLLGAAWMGVDVFFVLSGFLLGGILLDHRQAPNLFGVFYLRRACRILPLYFLFLSPMLLDPLFGLAKLSPALRAFLDTGEIPAWVYPLFLQNFAMSIQGSWGEAWISTTWSLAVEEQFYLLLPALICWCPPRRLPWVLVAMVCAAPITRMLLTSFLSLRQAEVGSYTLLPARWDSLLTGVLAAWIIRNPTFSTRLARRPTMLTIWLLSWGSLTFLLATWSPELYSLPMRTIWYSVVAFFIGGVIIAAHQGSLPGKAWLEWRWLTWIGRISYGLYLIHLPLCSVLFYLIARKPRSLNSLSDVFLMGLATAVSIAVAAISWHLIEQRILRFGRSYTYGKSQ